MSKPKNDFYYDGELPARRPFWRVLAGLLIALLVVGGAAGLVLTKDTIWTFVPELARTQTAEARQAQEIAQALQQTAQALDLAAQANNQQALDLAATQSALNNAKSLLDQTATQSMFSILASRTANAVMNEQQATRAALDYAATQSALNQIATQVELNFQSTRAALDQAGTAAAAGVLTPTSPPVPAASSLEADFTTGADRRIWAYDPNDWSIAGDGVLTAGGPGGWLLTQRADFSDYVLEVWLTPLFQLEGFYHILLNVQNTGMLVRLHHDGQRVIETGLYAFDRAALEADSLIPPENLRELAYSPVSTFNASEFAVRVEVRGESVTVTLNDRLLFNTLLSPEYRHGGAVGVELPVGTRLHRIRVTPIS